MPVSKNRRYKRQMKPRKFQTIKSARRYLKRFTWQFFANHRSSKELSLTMANAVKMVSQKGN